MERTEYIKIDKLLRYCLESNLVFSAYRKPEDDKTHVIVQSNHKLQRLQSFSNVLNTKGFLISPFDLSQEQPILIQPDYQFTTPVKKIEFEEFCNNLKSSTFNFKTSNEPADVTKVEYLAQINEVLKRIETGETDKVVLSRVKHTYAEYRRWLPQIFELLAQKYPLAFVFMFRVDNDIWLGATPEPFLQRENGSYLTSSVAGTVPFNQHSLRIDNWDNKEKVEQEYVSAFIKGVIADFEVEEVTEKGPYVRKAANLLHLRTDFSFKKEFKQDEFNQFVRALHPTSAVCGIPKEETKQLVKKLETHEREYYSGFLGPVGIDEKLSLFVNLRSMKVLEDCISLFVGGGITIDSDPEKEWNETELKAETLLSVIQEISDTYNVTPQATHKRLS